MTPKKKGTPEEIASIRHLLVGISFKFNTKYRDTWSSMCKYTADEAVYNCLHKKKFKEFAKLPVPELSLDTPLHLGYPSLDFVVLKM